VSLIIFINVSVLLFLLLFAWRLYCRCGSLLQLGILFAFTLAINYPLRILEMLFFAESSRPNYIGLLSTDNLLSLTLMQTPAIVAFCFGYWLWDHRVKGHPTLDSSRLPLTDVWHFGLLSFLYPVSLVAKSIKIVTGNYVSFLIGESQNLKWANAVENLHMLGWTCLAGVWVLFFMGRVRTPARWALFWTITTLELAYQVIQGSKTFLLLPLFILLLSFYYAKKRIPWKGAIAATLVAALIVFPFVSAYRDFFQSKYRGGIPSLGQLNLKETLESSYRDSQDEERNIGDSLLKMLSRFDGADELYSLTGIVPGLIPFKHGEDFEAILYVFIPRAIWTSKPVFSPGAAYGEILGTATSVTPFPIGEMYWNFGYYGMTVGMMLWGIFLAACMSLFDRLFKREELCFLVVATYLAQAYWLTTGEGMLAMQMATVIKLLVLYAVLYQAAKITLRATGVVPGVAKNRRRQGRPAFQR
jgi:hypothetical protein